MTLIKYIKIKIIGEIVVHLDIYRFSLSLNKNTNLEEDEFVASTIVEVYPVALLKVARFL